MAAPRILYRSKKLKYSALTLVSLLWLFSQLKTFHIWRLADIFHNKTVPGEEGNEDLIAKVRDSITFLPLIDRRFSRNPLDGNTWFMSSLNAKRDKEGDVMYLKLPSEESKGRILCLKGRNSDEATWNSYALAWPDHLPHNSILMKGLTFISYEHFTFHNIWHAISSMMPFVGWYKNECQLPERWILYHEGKLKSYKIPWIKTLMESTFGNFRIENFDSIYGDKPTTSGNSDEDASACFEEALVMRHNEAGMSLENRKKSYDVIRCKARMYCNADSREKLELNIGMTILMRNGTRSFKNSSMVINIFRTACQKVEGCNLRAVYIEDLSPCEQVRLMGWTDVLVTQHGAQLTNMFLMDRNSSVMELMPHGFLEYGKHANHLYHWLAAASGMIHRGNWYDPVGEKCPKSDRDSCLSIAKTRQIGYNETYFLEWAGKVLEEVKRAKNDSVVVGASNNGCGCTS